MTRPHWSLKHAKQRERWPVRLSHRQPKPREKPHTRLDFYGWIKSRIQSIFEDYTEQIIASLLVSLLMLLFKYITSALGVFIVC